MNNSITLNPNVKKASRSAIFSQIREKLRESQDGNESSFTSTELETMFKYFMPAIPKKAKTQFQRVAKFAATKDLRSFLNYVYVEDGFIMATNGHILIKEKDDSGRDNGYYCPKSGERVSESSQYPDINKIIAPTENYVSTFNLDTEAQGTSYLGEIERYEVLDRDGIQANYVRIALNGETSLELRMSQENNQPYRIDTENGLVILMPMRIY